MSDAPMIWALDVSKRNTGFVVGRAGQTPRATSIVGSGLDAFDAAWKLCEALNDRWSLDRPDWIFFEAPLAAGVYSRKTTDPETGEERAVSNAHTAMQLMAVATAVTIFADGVGVPRRAVNVQTVRKEFVGRARFDKKDDGKRHAKAMCDLLGWPARNMDEADAFAVWHYGTTVVAKKHAAVILPSMHGRVSALVCGPPEQGTPLFRRRA